MFSRFFIFLGILFLLIGLFLFLADKFPSFRIPYLGRLPGDIIIKKDHFSFYFPLTTCILISIILSTIFWLIKR